MRRWITAVALLFAAAGTLVGCGNDEAAPNREVTIVSYLEAEGFHVKAQHPLLSLEKIRGEQGGSYGSFSGSSNWFLFGSSGKVSGSSSSHLEPGSSLDFAITTSKHQVSVLEIPYSKIEFALDAHTTNPKAYFTYDEVILYVDYRGESLWSLGSRFEKWWERVGNKERTIGELDEMSLSQMIESHLRSVTLTISKAMFSQEVLPLVHQLPVKQAKAHH